VNYSIEMSNFERALLLDAVGSHFAMIATIAQMVVSNRSRRGGYIGGHQDDGRMAAYKRQVLGAKLESLHRVEMSRKPFIHSYRTESDECEDAIIDVQDIYVDRNGMDMARDAINVLGLPQAIREFFEAYDVDMAIRFDMTDLSSVSDSQLKLAVIDLERLSGIKLQLQGL